MPMNVIHRRGWGNSRTPATPEHFFFNRRAFVAGGAAALALAAAFRHGAQRRLRPANLPDPTADLYSAKRTRNMRSTAFTDERSTRITNNFYESIPPRKSPSRRRKLTVRPWTIKIDGMVEKPMEVGIDDLVRS